VLAVSLAMSNSLAMIDVIAVIVVRGSIRTTIGQAELLMAERFKQFAGLVDNCEFGTGLKEVTCSDLQGFWDMVYFQVCAK